MEDFPHECRYCGELYGQPFEAQDCCAEYVDNDDLDEPGTHDLCACCSVPTDGGYYCERCEMGDCFDCC
jgi:hypothetical protein